jgi:cell division protein FtsI/penicillin-binding protein 2
MAAERNRLASTLIMLSLGLAALVVQLVRVQFGPFAPIFAAEKASAAAIPQQLSPGRGLILDSQGRLMATNETRYFVEIETRQLTATSRRDIATLISELLQIPREPLVRQLNEDFVSAKRYRVRLTMETDLAGIVPIVLDSAQAKIVSRLLGDPQGPDLNGLDLVASPRRVYPAGSLAGHVLGIVNQEGQGFFGVEGYYDEWLAGKSITAERVFIPLEVKPLPDLPSGVNLMLTLDMDIQQSVEEILYRAVDWADAAGGQIIVMDPMTGEILAMAAWPPLDPNQYEQWLLPPEEEQARQGEEEEAEEEAEAERVITPAVAGTFEPGSTFKVLVMAAALDSGVVQPWDEFIDTGEIEVGGHTIRNWDGEAWGPQNMVGCLEHSLNVCLAWISSTRLGTARFYQYMRQFGIGKLTGVDLDGEVAGEMRTPGVPGWTEADLGTNAFGQGISVTPIQLMRAVAAVANGGKMIKPRIVREIISADGSYQPKATVTGNAISASTSRTLTRMLVEALENESSYALVDGYRLAGKTGTAQIPTEFGYDPNTTIASFIGWGPVDDPRFLVLVRIDRPKISPWGSTVAAPVFRQVVERLVLHLGIPPQGVLETPALPRDR